MAPSAPAPEAITVPGGLGFPESPRWQDGRLWFVDVFRGRVLAAEPGGRAELIAQVDDDVSGLGFLPGGDPLVVSMRRRLILRLRPGAEPVVHADLGAATTGYLNDMVVDADGRAHVGMITHVRDPRDGRGHDAIAAIDPSGRWRIAATGLSRPNGMVVTADRGTLIQASTTRGELVAWSIGDDGTLADQRVWATTGAHRPDGICADAEGAIWVGGLSSGSFVRIEPGGRITDEIAVAPRWAVACALGGDDRRTLFLLTAAPGRLPIQAHPLEHAGFVASARVRMAGAGRP